jgi:hypothetical protein
MVRKRGDFCNITSWAILFYNELTCITGHFMTLYVPDAKSLPDAIRRTRSSKTYYSHRNSEIARICQNLSVGPSVSDVTQLWLFSSRNGCHHLNRKNYASEQKLPARFWITLNCKVRSLLRYGSWWRDVTDWLRQFNSANIRHVIFRCHRCTTAHNTIRFIHYFIVYVRFSSSISRGGLWIIKSR